VVIYCTQTAPGKRVMPKRGFSTFQRLNSEMQQIYLSRKRRRAEMRPDSCVLSRPRNKNRQSETMSRSETRAVRLEGQTAEMPVQLPDERQEVGESPE
jgi:hypothetical protein